jgi:hypothetical protein
MRFVHTLILRLYIDSDHPEALRGAFRLADESETTFPFRDAPGLLILLKRLAADQAKIAAASPPRERESRK